MGPGRPSHVQGVGRWPRRTKGAGPSAYVVPAGGPPEGPPQPSARELFGAAAAGVVAGVGRAVPALAALGGPGPGHHGALVDQGRSLVPLLGGVHVRSPWWMKMVERCPFGRGTSASLGSERPGVQGHGAEPVSHRLPVRAPCGAAWVQVVLRTSRELADGPAGRRVLARLLTWFLRADRPRVRLSRQRESSSALQLRVSSLVLGEPSQHWPLLVARVRVTTEPWSIRAGAWYRCLVV